MDLCSGYKRTSAFRLFELETLDDAGTIGVGVLEDNSSSTKA